MAGKSGQGGISWEEKVVLALIYDGSKAQWESGIRIQRSEVPHCRKIRKIQGICFRDVCTAVRLSGMSCKHPRLCVAPENHLQKQEYVDEQALWREGLRAVLQSEHVIAFHALFGSEILVHELHVADTLPRLTAQRQKEAQTKLKFQDDKLVQKIIANFLSPEWTEWQETIQKTYQTFRYHEKVDLSVDPDWPVDTCNLTWVNNRIRDPKNNGRRDWWRNFHNEGLLLRFKTTRLSRLAIIFKAMLQEKDPNSSAIEPFPSLYYQDGMREQVAWLKEISIAYNPPSDRDLLGRPECIVSVCRNLVDLKKLFCIFVLVSEKGNPDDLYATLNAEQEDELLKRRITVNGLSIVGNAIADSSVQPSQYLTDQYLYSNMIQQANIAEYRASRVRPGPSGIEFRSAYLEVCVHAYDMKVLRLPLLSDFNPEDHIFKGDAEILFWEKMKSKFKDSGLHEEANEVCGDRVSDKWDLRKKQFWTEVWSRRGNLAMKVFLPCRTNGDISTSLGKRAQPEQPEGTSDQVVVTLDKSQQHPLPCQSPARLTC